MTRAEYLGKISAEYQNTVAVAGSHGKTTVTAMLAEIFNKRGPTVHMGGSYSGVTEPIGGKEFFITEACEYKRGFLSLKPSLGVVLNAELDHTDCYRNESDYFDAFKEFCLRCTRCVVFGDDEKLYKFAREHGFITAGFNKNNDYTVQNIMPVPGGKRFEVTERGNKLCTVSLPQLGLHSVLNALFAAAAARTASITTKEITDGLKRFKGVRRRFEFLGKKNGADIYSDYAHHPTELCALVETAKELDKKRLIIIFQPHTYTRTKSLKTEFAKCLCDADKVFLLPVYAAREKLFSGGKSNMIEKEMRRFGKRAAVLKRADKLYKKLGDLLDKDAVAVFAGAGDVDDFARNFIR
jgi:UDP-N-acetylmuramate--alanine ligase